MAGTAAALGTLAVGASAATSATGIATAGLIGFGGSVSTLGVLSLAGTSLGILSSIGASNAQRGEARQAGYDENLQAKAANLRGLQESNRIKKALLRDISTATARAGQAGIGGGLLSQQVAGIESDAADELNTSQFNTNMESRQRKAKSALYRKTGRRSILDYVGPVAEGGSRLATQAMAR